MTPNKAVPQAAPPRKRARGRPTCDCTHGADALLLNARRIFAQRGFYASSVRQIAEASGVDAALISHHFGSKEALWVAVVDQIASLTHALIEQTDALQHSPLGPAERIEQAVRVFVDAVFENPDVGMFFSTAATEEGERLDVLTQRLVRPYRNVMVPLVADWLEAQKRPVADADVMFFMLTSAISKTVSYRHMMGPFLPPEGMADLKRTVLDCAMALIRQ
ncbi:TetR/AcrR family transcriptional regulator [Pandoraea communis]|uniref:TetR family transcriptional regulator n=1 Tax=Pandoraea communis TaxID=2508297 RepID=A0A5E4SEK7_9BURK|nr:TetR/AcrR family transcriptional regulator [Pandoraea communis]MDM8354739.1 TetR/AcrR family transcriptional regulator [Pandoraea communis]VVD72904.1 TetR family transcriptional regulator [Pandoraea communis]